MAEHKPQYVGVRALTLVRRVGGQMEYVYAGAPIPGDATLEEIERLEREGFIAAVSKGVDPSLMLDTPPDPGLGPVTTAATPPRPADDAPKAAWVAYAVAVRPVGQTGDEARVEANKLSGAQLASKYPAAPAV